MSSIKVTRRPQGGWKWEASVRPPGHERVWSGGTSLTKWGAQRSARHELHRLLEIVG